MNIKDYLMEIVTTIILFISAFFLFYNSYYEPLMSYQTSIEELSKLYESEKKTKEKALEEKIKQEKRKDKTLNTVPSVLKAINKTCKDSGVIIRELSPSHDNLFQFEVKVISTYSKFLKILSEFEKLNIVIENISMDIYEVKADNPKKIITLTVRVVGDVTSMTTDELKKSLNRAISSVGRNPFTASTLRDGKAQRKIDLTYLYRLTSITPKKDNPFATIDKKDYFIGDEFLDKGEIKSIGNGKVELSKRLESGIEQKYFIGYRRSKKNK